MNRRLLLANLPAAVHRLDQLCKLGKPELLVQYRRRLVATGRVLGSAHDPATWSRDDLAWSLLEVEYGARSDAELLAAALRAMLMHTVVDRGDPEVQASMVQDDPAPLVAYRRGYAHHASHVLLLLDSLGVERPPRDPDAPAPTVVHQMPAAAADGVAGGRS